MLVRRNALVIFMSVELMLNAVNVNLIAFAAYLRDLAGVAFALFVIAVAAAEVGIKTGPDYHGLLKQIHVAETEEKALENARQFMWMQGEFTGLAHPVWSTPAGYGSPSNRRGFAEFSTGRGANLRYRPSLEKQLDDLMIIAGTPKQVIAKLRILINGQERLPELITDGVSGIIGQGGMQHALYFRSCCKPLRQRKSFLFE